MSAQGMRVEGSWEALGTRGFVVVRQFFSNAELVRLRDVHRRSRCADVAIYRAMTAGPEAVAVGVEKVRLLLPKIRRATDFLTDTVVPEGVFFSTAQMRLGWHSDQKSDYLFQGHRHHLTFWLPIEKPVPHKSGLAVVPMDRLRAQAPNLFRVVLHRGSARCEGGMFCYEEDGADRRIPCPVDLDEICEAPDLAAGDALVVRSDVLHRTGDVDTARVSLSLRALWGGHRLSVQRLLRSSPRKRERMLGEPNAFREALAAFLLHRRSQITVSDFLEARQRFGRKEFVPLLAFASARALLPSLLAVQRFRRSAPSS